MSSNFRLLNQKLEIQPGIQTRFDNLPPDQQADFSGVGCTQNALQTNVKRLRAPNESEALAGCVVRGTDRPTGLASGYGGLGATNSENLRLTVGRPGPPNFPAFASPEPIAVNNSYKHEAASMEINQCTDAADNLGLKLGKEGSPKAKSAIICKADNAYIVSRESMVLTTRTDRKNSAGAEINQAGNILFNATNNPKELQPLLKGGDLIEGINKLVYHVNKLNGILDAFQENQSRFNRAISDHTHEAARVRSHDFYNSFSIITEPSMQLQFSGKKCAINELSVVKTSCMGSKANLTIYTQKYSAPWGNKSVQSRYVKTT